MFTTTRTISDRIKRKSRTVLIILGGRDALRVSQRRGQAFQRFPEAHIQSQSTIHSKITIDRFTIVAIVLHHGKMVKLIIFHLRISNTITGNGVVYTIFINIFGDVARTGQQVIIVILFVRTAYLDIRLIFLTMVTADSNVSFQPVVDLHINTCTIVISVIVKFAKVTILLEIADSTKIVGTFTSTTYVDSMTLGETGLPIVIQQVVVQTFHSLQLICLI